MIALVWPDHVHHGAAQSWFARNRGTGFRTCPLTQLGFLRIISNPAFLAGTPVASDALELLERIVNLPEHQFWADEIEPRATVASRGTIQGHRQFVDAYLLELADHFGGCVATFDSGLNSLAQSKGIGDVLLLSKSGPV